MHTVRRFIAAPLAAAAVALAPAVPAAPTGGGSAPTGPIEITQDKALAGSVTSGDTAGFPVTLSQRGSYRLMSNLVVPSNANGIHITSDDVTLDLNGFAITGPVQCGGTPVTCNTSNDWGGGIVAYDVKTGITVRNGTVRGFGSLAMSIGNGRVEKMQLVGNAQGINMQRGVIADSVVQGNAGLGIWIFDGGAAIGNTIVGNGSTGLAFNTSGGYLNNVFQQNAGGDVYGGKSMGHNLCGWALCP